MPNEVNDDENNVETDSYIDKKEQKHNVKAELRAKKKKNVKLIINV